jgi:hypothetical protein
MESTNRSAKAFRFGLFAGNLNTFTPWCPETHRHRSRSLAMIEVEHSAEARPADNLALRPIWVRRADRPLEQLPAQPLMEPLAMVQGTHTTPTKPNADDLSTSGTRFSGKSCSCAARGARRSWSYCVASGPETSSATARTFRCGCSIAPVAR